MSWGTNRRRQRYPKHISLMTSFVRSLARMYGLKTKHEEWKLSQLKPRTIGEPLESPESAEERVQSAMQRITHGVEKPLIVYENGDIVDGNHHYEAYKRLGFSIVPVIVVRPSFRLSPEDAENAIDDFDERVRQEVNQE